MRNQYCLVIYNMILLMLFTHHYYSGLCSPPSSVPEWRIGRRNGSRFGLALSMADNNVLLNFIAIYNTKIRTYPSFCESFLSALSCLRVSTPSCPSSASYPHVSPCGCPCRRWLWSFFRSHTSCYLSVTFLTCRTICLPVSAYSLRWYPTGSSRVLLSFGSASASFGLWFCV